MKTLAFTTCDQWILVALGRGSPNGEDWRHYTAFLRRVLTTRQRALVRPYGAGLETDQRRELEEILGPHRERDRKVAVISDSTFTWGFVAALRLLDPTYRAFTPGEVDRALEYIDVPRSSWTRVKDAVDYLCGQVVPPGGEGVR